MSKELHNVPWDRLPDTEPRKPHPRAKYPWDKWFNGKTHLLIHGEDFDQDVDNFRQYVTTVASAKRVSIKTKKTRHGDLYLRKVGTLKPLNRKDPTIEAVLRGEPVPRKEREDEGQGHQRHP